jgi:hypothetical protein
VVLGFTIVKRLYYFNLKNVGFLLNHTGLFIVLVAALLGSGDIKVLNYYCYKGKPEKIAYDEKRNAFEMPYTLELIKFDIEEYPPSLMLFRNDNRKIIYEKNKTLIEVIKGKTYRIKDYSVTIDNYLDKSLILNDSFVQSKEKGAASSALITIENLNTLEKKSGWVSNGSYKYSPKYMQIDDYFSIYMAESRPKRYRSNLKLTTSENEIHYFSIEVNKSYHIGRWNLYQSGYDNQAGRWSDYSIIQAVFDPWLNFVYFGLFLLIAGTFFMFWQGKKI